MTLRLSRRAAFGLAFACGLLLGSGEAFAEKIVISNWDGYMPADLLANFTKETGIEAEMSVHATNEEIMGKVVAGGGKGYDVLFVSSPFVEALQNLKLIAPLDAAKIPNLANLYPEARALAYDPGNAHSVPYAWGTTGLCYRSDLVKTAPTSWMDLLQPSADITDPASTAPSCRARLSFVQCASEGSRPAHSVEFASAPGSGVTSRSSSAARGASWLVPPTNSMAKA